MGKMDGMMEFIEQVRKVKKEYGLQVVNIDIGETETRMRFGYYLTNDKWEQLDAIVKRWFGERATCVAYAPFTEGGVTKNTTVEAIIPYEAATQDVKLIH